MQISRTHSCWWTNCWCRSVVRTHAGEPIVGADQSYALTLVNQVLGADQSYALTLVNQVLGADQSYALTLVNQLLGADQSYALTLVNQVLSADQSYALTRVNQVFGADQSCWTKPRPGNDLKLFCINMCKLCMHIIWCLADHLFAIKVCFDVTTIQILPTASCLNLHFLLTLKCSVCLHLCNKR